MLATLQSQPETQVLDPAGQTPVGVWQLQLPSQVGGVAGSQTPSQYDVGTKAKVTATQLPPVVLHCSVSRHPAVAGKHLLSVIDSVAQMHGLSGSVVVVEPLEPGIVVEVVELVVVVDVVVVEVDDVGGAVEVVVDDVVVVGVGTHW
jgi:hypothetical protein